HPHPKSHSQVEPKESSSPTDTPNQTLTEKQEEEEKEEEEAEAAEEQAGKAPEEAEKRQEEAGPKEEGEAVSPVVEQPAETKEVKAESSVLSPLKLGKKMKIVVCHVTLLDGTQFPCEVEKRAKGQYLFFKVCEHLNLLEKDYFGLSFKDNADQRCWLDPTKEIKRQIRSEYHLFIFISLPHLHADIHSMYLLCLQLRQDVSSGRLPCSFVTHALLGSYTLQAELGDYDPEEQRLDSIADFQFAPSQTKELEEKVVELHKSHRGMTPAQADVQFLENAKKLSMYGVDLHHAKDSEGVDIMLGVCANGLLIYKDRLRINRFAWPKILKISYKRSNFYIKIRPGEAEQFESTVGFKLPNHRAAKRVWKVCVEHHTFFRLTNPEQPTKSKFLTLGSKFRYSGRTQAQTRQASTLIDRPAPYFERTSSKRISRSLDGGTLFFFICTATEEVPEVKEEEEKSASSDSESEEEAEFHPQSPSDSAHHIQEEPEEEQEHSQEAPPTNAEPQQDAEPETTDKVEAVVNQQKEEDEKTPGEETVVAPEDAPNGHHVQDGEEALTSLGAVAEEEEELEPCVVNGDASHAETERVPQVICCSEPPVVKTEMVTISDTFAAQKTEIATKEVPIVHTETKTITYEAAQLDGTGDGEPGVLMTAQTITSESLCTTTTTHITKTLKGGLSETRIEKRIVITGDSDIDHDQALAQAIKEAKEQHPDMSVTRVVVHKETELAEDDD
uniref:Erythrocyte membrane protein band 4.1 like 2 n=1 Tax=Astyanax mexicanus TaxID=7994 RepID=A0A8B9RN15_ASTMX